MSEGKPSFPILTTLTILFLCFATQTIEAQQNNQSPFCVSSSCGQIVITYPFRLATDPANCGHPNPVFELECQGNLTIFSSNSRKFNVQSISYHNFSMRVTNPGIVATNYSSCPLYPSLGNDISSTYISQIYSGGADVTFVDCLSPVNNPSYVEDPFCGNSSAFSNSSRVYSYLQVGHYTVSELVPSCSYGATTWFSPGFNGINSNNYSYRTIHDLMAYGLELTWYSIYCGECDKSNGRCSLENDRIRCRHYCYEDTPFEEKTFLCKLEYHGALLFIIGITIGSIIGLRFVIGVTFIICLVVYKRRQQRLSMDKSEIKEDDIEQKRDDLVRKSFED